MLLKSQLHTLILCTFSTFVGYFKLKEKVSSSFSLLRVKRLIYIIYSGLRKHIVGEIMAKLQPAAVKQITEIVERYKNEPTPTMMILEDIQKEYGYIPLEVQELVSDLTGVPVSDIYGVVTFYSFFSMTPKGKYVIGVCLGTACYVKGSQLVLDKFSELLGIKPGETTEDGLFTLDVLRCIGACAVAPAVSINGKVYPQVKVDNVKNIIAEYRAKEA